MMLNPTTPTKLSFYSSPIGRIQIAKKIEQFIGTFNSKTMRYENRWGYCKTFLQNHLELVILSINKFSYLRVSFFDLSAFASSDYFYAIVRNISWLDISNPDILHWLNFWVWENSPLIFFCLRAGALSTVHNSAKVEDLARKECAPSLSLSGWKQLIFRFSPVTAWRGTHYGISLWRDELNLSKTRKLKTFIGAATPYFAFCWSILDFQSQT